MIERLVNSLPCCVFSMLAQSGGRALLMLLPSEEEGVLAGLKPKNIPIKKLTINPEKVRALHRLCCHVTV